MNTTKNDELGLWIAGRCLGQLKGVARDICKIDDLIALVMVAENHGSLAQGGSSFVGSVYKRWFAHRWEFTLARNSAFAQGIVISSQYQQVCQGSKGHSLILEVLFRA